MTNANALSMPWAPQRRMYCAPGKVVLKLTLGEMPAWIPTARDVKTGALPPAAHIDGGRIDAVLARFSSRATSTRLHGAAASRHQFAQRHTNYTDEEMVFGLARTLRVSVDADVPIDDLVTALRQIGNVETATPHYLCMQSQHAPANPPIGADAAWASRDLIRAAEALAYEPGDPAVIVAIVDTGVQLEHADLRGRLRTGFDTVQVGPVDVSAGLRLMGDLSNEDMDPEDEVGHGTSCAGIIGARGDSLPPGLAGECSMLPMRVLAAATVPGKGEPVGVGAIADIDDGLKRAIDLGAKVLNLSFGTPIDSLDPNDPIPHLDVIKYAQAHGCVLIAASGNTGTERQFSPACLAGVISVGAVDDHANVCAFTTRNEQVALCAPGERVVSLGLKDLARVTGTSFAAPFVTAAAALLVARASRRAAPLDGHAVERILTQTAQPFGSTPPKGAGAGVLDVAAALRRLDHDIDTSSHEVDMT